MATSAPAIDSDRPPQLVRAMEHKNKGNTAYGEKKFSVAIREYHSALMIARGLQNTRDSNAQNVFIDGMQNLGKPVGKMAAFTDEIGDIVAKSYCNLAACIIARDDRKSDDYLRAIEYCNKVLEMKTAATQDIRDKALFRKARAYFLVKDFDMAHRLLSECKGVEANALRLKCQSESNAAQKRSEDELRQNFQKGESRRRAMAEQNE